MAISELRQKALNNLKSARVHVPKPVRFELEPGVEVELRCPTIKQAAKITDLVNRPLECAVECAVECLYEPGTDNKIFDQRDREDLMALPAGTAWLSDLSTVVFTLIKECADAGKISAKT